MASGKQGLVFMSCGQYRREEIQLGQELARAVDHLTNFEGCIARNQTSLDGLSEHIFGALDRCTGFIGVMHHRGTVKTPQGELVRASVWVEQELAIAAFLRQAQGRQLAVAVYIEQDIQRKGVRDTLLLGDVEFETEVEVLADFKTRLADGTCSPVAPASNLFPSLPAEPALVSNGGRPRMRFQRHAEAIDPMCGYCW